MRQERRPTVLGYIFSPSAYSNIKRKKLNPKAMITYKRPTTFGQKLTNYKDLALNKTRKQTKGGSRSCEHCALCGCYGNNNKSMVPNVSQLLTKTKTFKLNQSLSWENLGFTSRLVWYVMNSMLVKLATNFPKDGQRIAVIGTNEIVKLTVTWTRWPCRGTIQKTTAL